MSIVDINKIINGTPQKVLNRKYEIMKENYNETTAQDYYDVYSKQPLSFLCENSRMIFSEPYFGYQYYKEAMENISLCNFTVLESEHEKVLTYLEENADNMSEEQKTMYQVLESSLADLLSKTKNTRVVAEYVKEHVSSDFEASLSDSLFAYEKGEIIDSSNIVEIFDAVESSHDANILYMLYMPYANQIIESGAFTATTDRRFALECESADALKDNDVWASYIEKVNVGNKLMCDAIYSEAVSGILNANTRMIINYYCSESVSKKLDELRTEHVENVVLHSNPVSLVNSIFDDINESTIYEEEYESQKKSIDEKVAIAIEKCMDLLICDYQNTDNTNDIIQGYSFFNNNETYESAYNILHDIYDENVSYLKESDEIDDLENEINEPDEHYGSTATGKKPKAPQPKNLANKVQFKAMDKEVQQRKRMSVNAQKGQEIKGAVKAATQLPKNVIDSIKQQIHLMDEKDDERRKNYMTEPGFRKKGFRNLKLAILYGTAANVKLALVPVVMMSRHYSKKKDVRMRNELVRELETEIKVCEEKIADANANNDNAEKYRLIRIKDQLNAEVVRVKTNSKFV